MGLLYGIIIRVCFIIPMVFTYDYNIYVSMNTNVSSCESINDIIYHCHSVNAMLKLLSHKNSTEVFIQSGVYILNMSCVLEDLHDIQIRSNASNPAMIMCHNNSDVDTGVTFLRIRNLTIEHLSIVGCGMKHITSSYNERENLISVRSAIFIQNTTDVFLVEFDISNSTGIGLLVYDTSGVVNITRCTFMNNKLDSMYPNASGGGIHIEFTKCTPGVASCDFYQNTFNKNSKYIIDNCTFVGNAATYSYSRRKAKHFTNDHFVTFNCGGGLSLWIYGQAKNNSFKIISSVFIANDAKRGGGGLYVVSRQNATHNYVEITGCSFIENVGYKEGGGLVVGNTIYQSGGLSTFNTYNVSNCSFQQNQALTGAGGGVLGYGSREPEKTKPTNRFEIHNSLFINNRHYLAQQFK